MPRFITLASADDKGCDLRDEIEEESCFYLLR